LACREGWSYHHVQGNHRLDRSVSESALGNRSYFLTKPYSIGGSGDGQEMFEHAAKMNFEGIISKNAAAPYRSDRNEAWLKIKTVQKGKFPVIGFVKDPTGVAAQAMWGLTGGTGWGPPF